VSSTELFWVSSKESINEFVASKAPPFHPAYKDKNQAILRRESHMRLLAISFISADGSGNFHSGTKMIPSQASKPILPLRPLFASNNPSRVNHQNESFSGSKNKVYRGSIDRPFRILKVEWSTYDIDHADVRGTLRLAGIPSHIYEVPEEHLPLGTLGPVFTLAIQGVVGFVNQGKKGASDPRPITQDEYPKLRKEDITSYAHARDEPLNEFMIEGSPPLLVRTKTVLLKVELVRGRYDAFGDPQIIITHDTSHSVSEYKAGALASP
jgi:hypothetical protein